MKDIVIAASPDEYEAALDGWRRTLVGHLRRHIAAAGQGLDERIKWGHIVYFSGGPVALIRAESQRVLFGFWRGKRLCEIEPRLKPGGKYEMATAELREGDVIQGEGVETLLRRAAELNRELGDPTKAAAG